jgi:hypothetical protein
MTHRIFVDTEWTAAPWLATCELMWIGLADETGRSGYGISAEVAIDPRTKDAQGTRFAMAGRMAQ